MGSVNISLSCRPPHQDDLAKRPVFDQMVQGFACFGEGEDLLDNRLDGSTHGLIKLLTCT